MTKTNSSLKHSDKSALKPINQRFSFDLWKFYNRNKFNTITLLKVWMLEFFGINKAFHQKNKTKAILMIVGVCALVFLFLGMSAGYSVGIAIVLKPIHQLALLPVIMMTLTCLITLFTTIYKANSVLLAFEDYDMVMSLPIKTTTVLASRVWLLYIMNFLFSLVIMIPCGIVYAIFAAPSFLFYFNFIITLPFIPFIPIILATFLGGIVSFITARFKHANMIATVFYLALFIAIMMLSITANPSTNIDFASLGKQVSDSIYSMYPLALLYAQSIGDCSLISTLLFVFISCVAFFLFVFLFAKVFQSVHTLLTTSKANANYKLTELKQTSPFKALYIKECKRYFSSTLYVINTSFGLFLAIISCLSILIFGIDKVTQVADIPNLPLYLAQYTPFVVSLFIALSCTTACAISIEGKNLWIIKSSPIPISTIFFSKIVVNLTVTIPIVIICPTILSFVIPMNWFQIAMTFVIPLIYCFLISIIGLIVNLQFPVFDWTTEVTVIKQSSSVLVAMLAGFAIIAIPIGLAVILTPFGNTLSLAVIAVFLFLLTFMSYRYLMTRGSKQFHQL